MRLLFHETARISGRNGKSAGYSTKVPDSSLLMVYMDNIIKVSQIQEGIMKKKISLLLIAMLSLTSLAACGEKADAETPQEGGRGDRHQ